MKSVNTPVGTDLAEAAKILKRGGLVAMPTETVYGLAGNAFDPSAVARIFAAKNRPTFDPLIVHIAETNWLPRVVKTTPPLAEKLMAAFWPGPLTIVLEKTPEVADLVTSGLPTVAVRMPEHPLAQELLRLTDRPLAAPSANLFGRTSPTTAQHVAEQLSGRIDYILDGGPCKVGIESTIVRITQMNVLQILRPGGISREELAEMGTVETVSSFLDEQAPVVPGQLKEHYAPRTPLTIFSENVTQPIEPGSGLLTLQVDALPDGWQVSEFRQIEELSPSGDLQEAATHFFAALHRLDAAGLRRIYATPFPERGLGIGMNDRLQRAAHS